MRSIMFVLMLTFVMVSFVNANVIIVDNSWHFSGDYTSIQAAVNNSQTGDTILVYGGNYNESVLIIGPCHDGLVLRAQWNGYPSNAVYWYANDPIYLVQIYDVAGVVIEGFTIVNTSSWGITYTSSPGDTLTIRHNTIYGSPGYGISAISGSGYSELDGTMEIRNNIFREHSVSAIQGGCGRIVNNTFVDCNTAICLLDSNSLIRNNIIQDCGTGIVWWANTLTNTGNIAYNDFWETSYPVQNINSPGIPFMFANPLANEPWYYMNNNTPCRDAGNPDPVYNDPDGSRNDIGCYGGPGGLWNGWDGFTQSVVGKDEVKMNFNYEVSASPNPFNPFTAISYSLPKSDKVSLNVYDVSGRLVANLVDERQQAGEHAVTFNGSSLASGIYFCQISAGSFATTQKLMLVK